MSNFIKLRLCSAHASVLQDLCECRGFQLLKQRGNALTSAAILLAYFDVNARPENSAMHCAPAEMYTKTQFLLLNVLRERRA